MPGRNRVPSFQLASGTTDERDGSYNLTTLGSIFYNTDTSNVEVYHEDPSNNVGWRDLVMNNKEQIDISGKLVVDGIVGIGTTNPTAKLEVNGNLAISGMLKTSNPAFSVSNATNGNSGPSFSGGAHTVITYDDVTLNKGNNYSTQSNVFTAPIDGIYTFTWGAIGNNSSGVYAYYPYKNNQHLATNDGRNIQLRIDTTASGSNYGNGEKTIVVSLLENETFGIRFANSSGGARDYGHTYTYFQGYLISYT